MQDSTLSRTPRTSLLPVKHGLLAAIVVVLAMALNPTSAFADGDPASDVLAQQSLFLPQDAGLSNTQQGQLEALLASASRSGFPIRVALIASPNDLGSITELWKQPQSYARFLGLELGLVYHGPLLIVMPDGLGIVGVNRSDAVKRAVAADVRAAKLGSRALTAIQQLTTAAGHPLSIPSVKPSLRSPPTDTTAWLVFAVGAILIALAWATSFRQRPPRLRRRPQPRAS
ncbi:MAG: hypothetical protein WCB67_19200 [Solirubrobacteraceae bacterium]